MMFKCDHAILIVSSFTLTVDHVMSSIHSIAIAEATTWMVASVIKPAMQILYPCLCIQLQIAK